MLVSYFEPEYEYIRCTWALILALFLQIDHVGQAPFEPNWLHRSSREPIWLSRTSGRSPSHACPPQTRLCPESWNRNSPGMSQPAANGTHYRRSWVKHGCPVANRKSFGFSFKIKGYESNLKSHKMQYGQLYKKHRYSFCSLYMSHRKRLWFLIRHWKVSIFLLSINSVFYSLLCYFR